MQLVDARFKCIHVLRSTKKGKLITFICDAQKGNKVYSWAGFSTELPDKHVLYDKHSDKPRILTIDDI